MIFISGCDYEKITFGIHDKKEKSPDFGDFSFKKIF